MPSNHLLSGQMSLEATQQTCIAHSAVLEGSAWRVSLRRKTGEINGSRTTAGTGWPLRKRRGLKQPRVNSVGADAKAPGRSGVKETSSEGEKEEKDFLHAFSGAVSLHLHSAISIKDRILLSFKDTDFILTRSNWHSQDSQYSLLLPCCSLIHPCAHPWSWRSAS